MVKKVAKVCVIGAGVMGSGIAAQVANSSTQVILLDMPNNGNLNDRNLILKQALEKMLTQNPLQLSHPDRLKYITIGNLEDDLELIRDCDLVIEVIIEKLQVKQQLYQKIMPYLKEGVILASNTSTLQLSHLKEFLPAKIKKSFLITHFFNPPRYMKLLELVTDQETSSQVIKQTAEFITYWLGKTIINSNDCPGFIANRVGCFLLEMVVREAILAKMDLELIDQVFTKYFGLPSTGIFGLYDLIGHDVMKLISTSLLDSLPKEDLYHQIYQQVPLLDQMLEKGYIGRKVGNGFYRVNKTSDNKKVKQVINFTDLTYKDTKDVEFPYKDFIDLLNSDDEIGRFVSKIIARFYYYISGLIPEVTDQAENIDLAMQMGFSWKVGPFLLLAQMPQFEKWLKRQLKLLSLKLPEDLLTNNHNIPDRNTRFTEMLFDNSSASLTQLENGRLVFAMKTKMNCLNIEVFESMIQAINVAENKQQDLIILPKGKHFSVGADLKYIANCIESNDFNALENFLRLGQRAMMRLKYASINVISCANGLALGGGCEILLHSDVVIANLELKAGLVESNLGLIPGWGGCKEMILRSKGEKNHLVKYLKNILTANQSISADYFIQDYGIGAYNINMNVDYLLDEAINYKAAKKTHLTLQAITLPNIDLQTELSEVICNKPASELTKIFQDLINQKTISEQELLDFERATFLALAKIPDSLAKIKALLS